MSGKGSRGTASRTGSTTGDPVDTDGTDRDSVDQEGTDQDGADPADALGYEQARDELAQVVATLESGGLSLDESLTLWERGEHLARQCTAFLDGARQRVDTVLAEADESAAES